jgi:hypothetical protein
MGFGFFTALCAQTQTKQKFANVAKQRLQIFACGSFDRHTTFANTADNTNSQKCDYTFVN